MTPAEMKQLAGLLKNMPGIKSLELKDVRQLADLLRDSPEIGSIEVKGWFGTGVVITRTGSGGPVIVSGPHPMPAPATHGSPAPAAGGPAPTVNPSASPVAASGLKDIKSPMVGTFYKAPEPGAEPYVKVGTRVSAGQTVCIIEAMKIMNEIEAEVTGVVREVLLEDASPVEFGQVLFRVDPNG